MIHVMYGPLPKRIADCVDELAAKVARDLEPECIWYEWINTDSGRQTINVHYNLV